MNDDIPPTIADLTRVLLDNSTGTFQVGRTDEHDTGMPDGYDPGMRLAGLTDSITGTGTWNGNPLAHWPEPEQPTTITRHEPASWWHRLLHELSRYPGFGWVKYRTVERQYTGVVIPAPGGMPAGIIEVPGKLSEQDFAEFADRWRAAHEGETCDAERWLPWKEDTP